ncbi:hypothetical protein [Clostridium arbusti]|jgi:hypothetical protein|uniref:hypothetical protein n=1 Tax=Clostridium arbusti TaxID=1137848 RepID=UPI00028A4119|nr:hypothetical protein [Clostridium arbusti]
MKIDIETAKKYLRNPKQAISDAKNSLFTESDLQSAIDEVYEDNKPKLTGRFFLQRSNYRDAPKMIVSQNYLDEVIKPFIEKVNIELNWKIRVPADIMK